jgi:hypothetical protein
MSDSKYSKWIITQPMKEEHGYEVKDGPDVISSMAYLDGGVVPGAFYAETHWFHKPTKYSPRSTPTTSTRRSPSSAATPTIPSNSTEKYTFGWRMNSRCSPRAASCTSRQGRSTAP